MKANIFYILILISVSSCAPNPSKKDQNAIVNRSLFADTLLDSNLKRDLLAFESALYAGDLDKAYSYFYIGAIRQVQSKFPEDNINEQYIKKNVLQFTYDLVVKLNSQYNAHTEYILGDITGKTKIENTLIYIINTSMDATIKGERKTLPSKTLCFSVNNGKSWTFMEYSKEITPLIITEMFGKIHVDEVLKLTD